MVALRLWIGELPRRRDRRHHRRERHVGDRQRVADQVAARSELSAKSLPGGAHALEGGRDAGVLDPEASDDDGAHTREACPRYEPAEATEVWRERSEHDVGVTHDVVKQQHAGMRTALLVA